MYHLRHPESCVCVLFFKRIDVSGEHPIHPSFNIEILFPGKRGQCFKAQTMYRTVTCCVDNQWCCHSANIFRLDHSRVFCYFHDLKKSFLDQSIQKNVLFISKTETPHGYRAPESCLPDWAGSPRASARHMPARRTKPRRSAGFQGLVTDR